MTHMFTKYISKVTKKKVPVQQTATKVEIEREADKKPDNNRRQKSRPNDKRERRPKPIRTVTHSYSIGFIFM